MSESETPKEKASAPKKKTARKSAKKAAKKVVKQGVRNARSKSAEEKSPQAGSTPANAPEAKPKKEKPAETTQSSTSENEVSTSPKESPERQQDDGRNRKRRSGRRGGNRRQAPPVAIDHEEVAQKAWKIFLGEVVEEGLALIDDREAREKSIKSFQLAEIFVIEKERRLIQRKAEESAPANEAEADEEKSED